MSPGILRRAAALMRERAESATPGPWNVEPAARDLSWPDSYWRLGTPTDGYTERATFDVADHLNAENDARHFASWPPAVALAVADWLHHAARDMWAHGLTDDDDDLLSPHLRDALAVARAYLGDAL